jgi:hypothetical protein
MSDIEDDMDPIQAMNTNCDMPDDGNDALFAVANLDFGVESHPEGTEADAAAKDDPRPNQRKRQDVPSHSLAHDAIKKEKLIYIHIDLETGGEAVEITRFHQALWSIITQLISDLEIHSTFTSSHHFTSRQSTIARRKRLSLVSPTFLTRSRMFHPVGQVCGQM